MDAAMRVVPSILNQKAAGIQRSVLGQWRVQIGTCLPRGCPRMSPLQAFAKR